MINETELDALHKAFDDVTTALWNRETSMGRAVEVTQGLNAAIDALRRKDMEQAFLAGVAWIHWELDRSDKEHHDFDEWVRRALEE